MVSVIVVSHDHKRYLNACLSSVMGQRGISFEVILVENASRDGTSQYVRENFPSIAMFRRKRRHGFAANVNYGILKSGGRYILVLNPDTRLYTGAIVRLVRCMDASAKIGICGPKLVNPDGSVQMSFRNFPTWKTALFRRTPLRYVFRNPSIVQRHLNSAESHDIARPVDWMLGACLLFRRKMLHEIGFLDEGYRLYVEDIDICLRARLGGWEVWYEPAARVMHHHGAKSDRSLLSVHSFFHTLSMIRYLQKFWLAGHLKL